MEKVEKLTDSHTKIVVVDRVYRFFWPWIINLKKLLTDQVLAVLRLGIYTS